MKILITGGCGFVGSNIAIYLKSKISNVKKPNKGSEAAFAIISVLKNGPKKI